MPLMFSKSSWFHLLATLALLTLAGPALAEPQRMEPDGPEGLQLSQATSGEAAGPSAGNAEPAQTTPGTANPQDQKPAEDKRDARVGRIGQLHDNIRRDRKRRSFFVEANELYGEYARFKNRLEQDVGLSYSIDLSYLQQWGWQNGGSPAGQFLVTPSIDQRLFRSAELGEGSLQIFYTTVSYPTRQTAADVSSNVGVITPINDFPVDQNRFAQLSYTHAFPGNHLLITAGQYPFYNFDGNLYLANQQENFNSYIFAQNDSSTYPIAGLGAYVQLNASKEIQLPAGFQNPNNLSGSTLSTANSGAGMAWFAYAQWTPRIQGLGSAQ